VRFASALSKTIDTETAAQEMADGIQAQLGGASIDLACLFFSAHHAAHADILTNAITHALRPKLLIVCS
jgi:small ligand-binding sensory domain FIST